MDSLVEAIRAGDLETLRALLDAHPELVNEPIDRGRTALQVAMDWPGYWPHAPESVRLLLAAGADPDGTGNGTETPLHWAASSDDVEVAEVLLDAGADLEAPGGSIAGSPPANAVGYGCWHVARQLVARGARVEWLWQAGAPTSTRTRPTRPRPRWPSRASPTPAARSWSSGCARAAGSSSRADRSGAEGSGARAPSW
jgi:hypothetical protein